MKGTLKRESVQARRKTGIWNLPNTLSLVRVAAVPVVIILLIAPGRRLSVIAAFFFVLICITDWLDGYFARSRGDVTSFGKFLDPLADKLLINTSFIMLIPLGRVPAWVVALILAREVAVTGLRAVASHSGVVIPAGSLGKYKTVLQIVCLVALLLHYTWLGINFHKVGILFLVPAFILTLWSGADYFVKFFKSHELK